MKPKASYFRFLEGIRGVAATLVCLFHVWVFALNGVKTQGVFGRLIRPLPYVGHMAVTVFITLSGFCLMLPIVEGKKFHWWKFLKRRSVRILPPYYASIALGLLAQYYAGGRVAKTSLAEHLIMGQNWSWDYEFDMSLNIVLWSVALEFQIYLLFPAIVWLYRKAGIWWTVAICCAIGFSLYQFWWIPPHPIYYLGIFALGMLAAWLSRQQLFSVSELSWLSAGAWIGLLILYLGPLSARCDLTDFCIGLATMCMLAAGAMSQSSIITRMFSWRPLVFLGTFSYSIYLVHYPFGKILDVAFVNRLHFGPRRVFLMRVALLPVISAFAYGFFWVIERPFLKMGKAGRQTVALSEATSPIAM